MSGKTLKLIPLIAKRDRVWPRSKRRLRSEAFTPASQSSPAKSLQQLWAGIPLDRAAMRSHIIFSGRLMAQTVDDDAANRAMGGLLGFQLYVGPPMKLELRNIWRKNL